jgi:hypothetical protein
MVYCTAVSSSQTKTFWAVYGGFCVGTIYSLGVQGAFDGIGLGQSLVFVAAYLGMAFVINRVIRSIPFPADE